MNEHLQSAKSQIKLIIRDLESPELQRPAQRVQQPVFHGEIPEIRGKMRRITSENLTWAKDQIKLIIRDLEREIGIDATAPINLHLAGALEAIAEAEREAARRRA